jgi:biotin carboxyl carrier protein
MNLTVQIDGHTYTVEIQDINKRPIVAIVDGERFEIHPETELGLTPVSEPVILNTSSDSFTKPGNSKGLVAPLPGTVTEIHVLPGAQVQPGQPVCVIEAMKMKNTIRADREGTILTVPVSPGQTVKYKQVLVEFTE